MPFPSTQESIRCSYRKSDCQNINYELYSNEAEEVICHSKRVLMDFHSKFNKKVTAKVRELKEIRTRERQMNVPTNLEIEEFISLEVAEKILNRYLKGTNINKLKRYEIIERLALIIREAFKVYYISYNTKTIKELDNITVDCIVLKKISPQNFRW